MCEKLELFSNECVYSLNIYHLLGSSNKLF